MVLAVSAAPATAQDRPVAGPGTICLKHSSFNLLPGEAVEGFGGGVESMHLTLRTASGPVEIVESEILARPRPLGVLVTRSGMTSIYRGFLRNSWSYRFTRPTDFATDGDRPLVLVLRGPGLKGGARDAAIYRRFKVGDPQSLQCHHRFAYGWDLMFDSTEEK